MADLTDILLNDSTLTEQIFQLSAPYDNPHQGPDPRVVFCCSAGLLRSASAARIAGNIGFNARSVGSERYALTRLDANILEWGYKIVFMKNENYRAALATFRNTGYDEDLERKSVVWNIDDNYSYMHPHLVDQLTPLIKDLYTEMGAVKQYPGMQYVGKTAWDV
jgi:predicted protein tyrosine phosphatase